MGTSVASEPLNCFIIVLYDIWPTDGFLPLPGCSYGNGRIDHFTDSLK